MTNEATYACSCCLSFITASELGSHSSKHLPSVFQFCCGFCMTDFDSLDAYVMHAIAERHVPFVASVHYQPDRWALLLAALNMSLLPVPNNMDDQCIISTHVETHCAGATSSPVSSNSYCVDDFSSCSDQDVASDYATAVIKLSSADKNALVVHEGAAVCITKARSNGKKRKNHRRDVGQQQGLKGAVPTDSVGLLTSHDHCNSGVNDGNSQAAGVNTLPLVECTLASSSSGDLTPLSKTTQAETRKSAPLRASNTVLQTNLDPSRSTTDLDNTGPNDATRPYCSFGAVAAPPALRLQTLHIRPPSPLHPFGRSVIVDVVNSSNTIGSRAQIVVPAVKVVNGHLTDEGNFSCGDSSRQSEKGLLMIEPGANVAMTTYSGLLHRLAAVGDARAANYTSLGTLLPSVKLTCATCQEEVSRDACLLHASLHAHNDNVGAKKSRDEASTYTMHDQDVFRQCFPDFYDTLG